MEEREPEEKRFSLFRRRSTTKKDLAGTGSKNYSGAMPIGVGARLATTHERSATLPSQPSAQAAGSAMMSQSPSGGLFSKLKRKFRLRSSRGKYDFKDYEKPQRFRRKSDDPLRSDEQSEVVEKSNLADRVTSSVKTPRRSQNDKENVILIRKDKCVSVICQDANGEAEVIFSNMSSTTEENSDSISESWGEGGEEDPYATINSVKEEIKERFSPNPQDKSEAEAKRERDRARAKELLQYSVDSSKNASAASTPNGGISNGNPSKVECVNVEDLYAKINSKNKAKKSEVDIDTTAGTTSAVDNEREFQKCEDLNKFVEAQIRCRQDHEYETLEDVRTRASELYDKSEMSSSTKNSPAEDGEEGMEASCCLDTVSDGSGEFEIEPDYETLEEVRQRVSVVAMTSPVPNGDGGGASTSLDDTGEGSSSCQESHNDPSTPSSSISKTSTNLLETPSTASTSIASPSKSPLPPLPGCMAPLAQSINTDIQADNNNTTTDSSTSPTSDCIYDNPNVILRKQFFRYSLGATLSSHLRQNLTLSELSSTPLPPAVVKKSTAEEEELIEKLSSQLAPPLPLRMYQKEEAAGGSRGGRGTGARHSWSAHSSTTKFWNMTGSWHAGMEEPTSSSSSNEHGARKGGGMMVKSKSQEIFDESKEVEEEEDGVLEAGVSVSDGKAVSVSVSETLKELNKAGDRASQEIKSATSPDVINITRSNREEIDKGGDKKEASIKPGALILDDCANDIKNVKNYNVFEDSGNVEKISKTSLERAESPILEEGAKIRTIDTTTSSSLENTKFDAITTAADDRNSIPIIVQSEDDIVTNISCCGDVDIETTLPNAKISSIALANDPSQRTVVHSQIAYEHNINHGCEKDKEEIISCKVQHSKDCATVSENDQSQFNINNVSGEQIIDPFNKLSSSCDEDVKDKLCDPMCGNSNQRSIDSSSTDDSLSSSTKEESQVCNEESGPRVVCLRDKTECSGIGTNEWKMKRKSGLNASASQDIVEMSMAFEHGEFLSGFTEQYKAEEDLEEEEEFIGEGYGEEVGELKLKDRGGTLLPMSAIVSIPSVTVTQADLSDDAVVVNKGKKFAPICSCEDFEDCDCYNTDGCDEVCEDANPNDGDDDIDINTRNMLDQNGTAKTNLQHQTQVTNSRKALRGFDHHIVIDDEASAVTSCDDAPEIDNFNKEFNRKKNIATEFVERAIISNVDCRHKDISKTKKKDKKKSDSDIIVTSSSSHHRPHSGLSSSCAITTTTTNPKQYQHQTSCEIPWEDLICPITYKPVHNMPLLLSSHQSTSHQCEDVCPAESTSQQAITAHQDDNQKLFLHMLRLLENAINGFCQQWMAIDLSYLLIGVFKWSRCFRLPPEELAVVEGKLKRLMAGERHAIISRWSVALNKFYEKRREKHQADIDSIYQKIWDILTISEGLPTFQSVRLDLLGAFFLEYEVKRPYFLSTLLEREVLRISQEDLMLWMQTLSSDNWTDGQNGVVGECSLRCGADSDNQFVLNNQCCCCDNDNRNQNVTMQTITLDSSCQVSPHSGDPFSTSSASASDSSPITEQEANGNGRANFASPSKRRKSGILNEFLNMCDSVGNDEDSSDEEDEEDTIRTYISTVTCSMDAEHADIASVYDDVALRSLCRAFHGELSYMSRTRKPSVCDENKDTGLSECFGKQSHLSNSTWQEMDLLMRKLIPPISPRLDFQFLLRTYAEFKFFILKERQRRKNSRCFGRHCFQIETDDGPRCCRKEEMVFMKLLRDELRHFASVIRRSSASESLFVEDRDVSFSLTRLLAMTLASLARMKHPGRRLSTSLSRSSCYSLSAEENHQKLEVVSVLATSSNSDLNVMCGSGNSNSNMRSMSVEVVASTDANVDLEGTHTSNTTSSVAMGGKSPAALNSSTSTTLSCNNKEQRLLVKDETPATAESGGIVVEAQVVTGDNDGGDGIIIINEDAAVDDDEDDDGYKNDDGRDKCCIAPREKAEFHIENYKSFRAGCMWSDLDVWQSPDAFLDDPNILDRKMGSSFCVDRDTNATMHTHSTWGHYEEPKPLQERDDFLESMQQLQMKEWYWGPLSYEQAESVLKNYDDGSFLVRDSSDRKYLLSLSFKSLGGVYHTRIEHAKGLFSFWSQPDSHGKARICEFIEKSVQNSHDGKFLYFLSPSNHGNPPLPIRLLNPVSRNATIPSLKHLSRFVIRQHVRRDLLELLPVPRMVIGYLRLKQFYVEFKDKGRWPVDHKRTRPSSSVL